MEGRLAGFDPLALVYRKVVQGATRSPRGLAREPDITPIRLRHPEPLVLDMVSELILVRATGYFDWQTPSQLPPFTAALTALFCVV